MERVPLGLGAQSQGPLTPRVWLRLPRCALGPLVLAVIVAACGPSTRYEYVKPGVDQQQVRRDMDACRAGSLTIRREDYSASETVDQSRFNRCMADRGYEVRER